MRAQLLTEVADRGVRCVARWPSSSRRCSSTSRPSAASRRRCAATGRSRPRPASASEPCRSASCRASDLDRYYAELLRSGNKPATVHHAWLHPPLAHAGREVGVGEGQRRRPSVASHRALPSPTAPDGRRRGEADRRGRGEPRARARRRLPTPRLARRSPRRGVRPAVGRLRPRRRRVRHPPSREAAPGPAHRRRRQDPPAAHPPPRRGHDRRAEGAPDTLEEHAEQLGAELVPEAYVLTDSPDGADPWKPNRLTQALRRLRDKAGYTGRLHDLRHWNTSQLLNAGESPVVVAARLGHRDPSTTHRWYAHTMPRADTRAAKLLNEALKPKLSDEEHLADSVEAIGTNASPSSA